MVDLGGLLEIAIVFAAVLAFAPYFGEYLGRVYLNRPLLGDRLLTPVETAIYRLLGTSPRISMRFREYVGALLLTSAGLFVWIVLLLTLQSSLPLNPVGDPGMTWDLASHTAASFLTNTDFTHFNPQSQLSYGAALFGLQAALFLSPAMGMSVAAAFIRGFTHKDGTLGNFYVDMVRTMTRVLLPLALVGAVVLVAFGVPQTLAYDLTAHTLGGGSQTIYVGPVASWESIMMLGTNGGGWFSANAMSPFENPNAASNLFQTGLMLLIPLGFPFAFAQIVRRPGEGFPFLATSVVVLFVALGLVLFFQSGSNPALSSFGFASGAFPGPGFETRFSGTEASLFQVVSVYSNTGATSVQIGSLAPLSQAVLLFGMFTQSTPGGDGTGFGMLLVFAVIAVFVGGLMVGRTPEYLGKKVGTSQMRWAAGVLLLHPALILVPLVVATVGGFVAVAGGSIPTNAYAFTTVLYEFTSEAANNGSAMGPIADGTIFFNVVGAAIMLIGRFAPMIGMLAIGSIFAHQDVLQPGPGTLQTRGWTFAMFLTLLVIILSGLLFLPVLVLGPFAQLGV